MDNLDLLVGELAKNIKKEIERRKKLPESEQARIAKRQKDFSTSYHETVFAEEYPDEAYLNSLNERYSKGSLLMCQLGDTTLFQRSSIKLVCSIVLFIISSVLLAANIYPIVFAALTIIFGCIEYYYIKLYFKYKMQKYFFIEIYETCIRGMSTKGIVEIGYSDIIFMKGTFDPKTSYKTPQCIEIETTKDEFEFPYINREVVSIIEEQKAFSTDSRRKFWSPFKIKYIDTWPEMCNI